MEIIKNYMIVLLKNGKGAWVILIKNITRLNFYNTSFACLYSEKMLIFII